MLFGRNCLIGTLVIASSSSIQKGTMAMEDFSGCNIEEYYESLSGNLNDIESMHTLLKSTHRHVLPYTGNNVDDVWTALIDLDGDGDGNVNLIYGDRKIPALPHGTASSWNREHVWPKSLGVGYTGADFTDVHSLRPADWGVNAARNNKLFGSCGTVASLSHCKRPAHEEAADDTETDPKVWLPPASVRGDLARALMYMAVRYDGGGDDIDLVLSDCPYPEHADDARSEMGYLSQLLQWHEADPVDDAERLRNARVCTNWQGNRNPFVDYPEIVPNYFGTPNETIGEGLGYDCPYEQKLPPKKSKPPKKTDIGKGCNGMTSGDVAIVAFNSHNPDVVIFQALSDLPPEGVLYMTDNAWTGTKFRTNEGTRKLVIPPEGIAAGSTFGYGDKMLALSSKWTRLKGFLALSASGDSIFLYCKEEEDQSSDTITISHLFSLTYNIDWVLEGDKPNERSYRSTETSMPPLNTAHLSLIDHTNSKYIGPILQSSGGSMSKEEVLDAILSPSNWMPSSQKNKVSDMVNEFGQFIGGNGSDGDNHNNNADDGVKSEL